MTQRPTVSIYSTEKKGEIVGTVPMPAVFSTPIRTEVVYGMHAYALLNLRQPYAVNSHSGEQTSAESWGTGRAVARIPRAPGGGTHRAGQGAFGNMCRGGRMFSPTKVWRRWAHVIKQNEKRYAVASAIAASSVAPLVMARGHAIESARELPLVISNDVESISKTRDAAKILRLLGVYTDVERVKRGITVRAGKGKNRNRRYRKKKGPLVIFKNNNGIARAFRNIPGVEVQSVDRLNLVALAPGGKVGRFIIWTQAAFEDLQARFGSLDGATGNASLKRRNGATYRLPRPQMINTDVSALVNSDAVQNVVKAVKVIKVESNATRRRNPLTNVKQRQKLNPHFFTSLRNAAFDAARAKTGKTIEKKNKQKQAVNAKIQENFYKKFLAPLTE